MAEVLKVSFTSNHPYSRGEWVEKPDSMSMDALDDGTVEVKAARNMCASYELVGGAAELKDGVVELTYLYTCPDEVVMESGTFFMIWQIEGLKNPKGLTFKISEKQKI